MKTTTFQFVEGRGRCLRGFSDPDQIVIGALVKLEHNVPYTARGDKHFGNLEGEIVKIEKSIVTIEQYGNQFQVNKKYL